MFGDEHQRAVLQVLATTAASPIDFETVCDGVVQPVQTEGNERDGNGSRQRVRTRLHHMHLPKLDDDGLIDYDTESKRIRTRTGTSD